MSRSERKKSLELDIIMEKRRKHKLLADIRQLYDIRRAMAIKESMQSKGLANA